MNIVSRLLRWIACCTSCWFAYTHKYRHIVIHASPPCISRSPYYIHYFLHVRVCTPTHANTLCLTLCISSFLRHTCTHRCPRIRKPTELEKRLSQDERLHTHCLHAEPLPTPSRDSAYCSRGLCYADTLQLASLPTPINAATHLHPFLSFTPFLSLPPCQWSSNTTVAAREQRST